MDKLLNNINVLRSFECAARHTGYSKAASELCISQAAVSQQMRQLEAEIGCQLFVRKGKHMLLTQEGETLFKATQQAMGILQKSISEIKNESLSGSLTITSTQAFTAIWLMPKLHEFAKQYPDIKIRVLSSAQFDDLKQQGIDLAIRFGPKVMENTDPTLICEYFGEEPVYPVCSAELVKTHKFIEAKDLLSTWLVTLDNPGVYNWPSWFEHAGVKAYQEHQQWTQVHSTDMALNAVLGGHGFTLAARYLCAEQLRTGQLVMPVNLPHPQSVKRYLVFAPNSTKKARLKVFVDWLKAEMPA